MGMLFLLFVHQSPPRRGLLFKNWFLYNIVCHHEVPSKCLCISEGHQKCLIFAIILDDIRCQVIFCNQHNLLQEVFGIPQIVQVYFVIFEYISNIFVTCYFVRCYWLLQKIIKLFDSLFILFCFSDHRLIKLKQVKKTQVMVIYRHVVF